MLYNRGMTNVVGMASRPKWRERRHTILLEIIGKDPTRRWSVRDIAAAMRRNPIISQVQPNYSHSTAHRDYLAIKEELREKREDLATDYISSQLEITENLLDDLTRQYEEVKQISVDDVDDPATRAQIAIKKIGLKKDLVAAIDRILARQQTLVPIAVPKKLDISEKKLNVNLDALLALKGRIDEVPRIESPDIIDGQFSS